MLFDRRDFVKSLTASFAAPAVNSALPSLGSSPATQNTESRKAHPSPNVIFMICDDLGFGDPGCYGSKLPTPNLDAMATAGLRFTRYNSAHPICSASRAALLTGRYGLRSNTTGAFGPHSPTGTSLDETLLSNLFHARGYKTKAIGKWHLGDKPEYLPTSRGFDSYYGVPYSVDMKPLPLIRDKTILEDDTDRNILTPRYTEEALKYIDESTGAPFFMYLAFSYPHDPARASKRFAGKTEFGTPAMQSRRSIGASARFRGPSSVRGLPRTLWSASPAITVPGSRVSPGLLRGRQSIHLRRRFPRSLFLAEVSRNNPRRTSSRYLVLPGLDILPHSLRHLPVIPSHRTAGWNQHLRIIPWR